MKKQIKLYDYNGKSQKSIDFSVPDTDGEKEETDIIAQYVRVFKSNQRQGTSKVKTRAEVRGGGRKPWKQKGTGRARAGSIRSPIWRGGGIIHGPSPKDWSLKLPKKIRRAVFNLAVSRKLAQKDAFVAFEFPKVKRASTKNAASFLSALKFVGKKTLIIHEDNSVLYKSFRNIKNVAVRRADVVSAFDLLNAENVLVEKRAISHLEERLK